MRDPSDRGSKWLIGHHGDSLLRLGGVTGVRSWRALLADVVHPRQLPDGLLEVLLEGQTEPDLFLVEVATYPEARVHEQLARDMGLVWLERRLLPEVLTLVLHPRGNLRVADGQDTHSRLGWTRMQVNWRVVELWTLPAADLLAANDVGLIPWVPLTRLNAPPEIVLQQCRQRIDDQAPPIERANLLAITQVMTRLRYNDPGLLSLFGGKQTMIESPLIQELVDEKLAQDRAKTSARLLSRSWSGDSPPSRRKWNQPCNMFRTRHASTSY